MNKLSVVIITFNEERNIEKCLEAVSVVADEIVVVDSFSTDNTKAICKKFNIHYYEHEFDNYVAQKNLAVSYAHFDYVLNVDADEVLSPELQNSINKTKENFSADAYYINRLTNYCGKFMYHGSWYPDKKIRLWNKNKGHFEGMLIHEKVIMNAGSIVSQLEGNLLHFSYHNIGQHISQINKFTDLTAKAAYNKGKTSNHFKIHCNPKWKFFRDFILHGGFLDGYYGWVIAKNSAYATFLKYSKLKELHKANSK